MIRSSVRGDGVGPYRPYVRRGPRNISRPPVSPSRRRVHLPTRSRVSLSGDSGRHPGTEGLLTDGRMGGGSRGVSRRGRKDGDFWTSRTLSGVKPQRGFR